MGDFFRRIRLPLLFAALLLLTLILMLGNRRALRDGGEDHGRLVGGFAELAAVVQKGVTWPVETTRGLWSGYVALLDVRRDNEALRARIAELEERSLQYREALVASGHLARIAAMRQDFEVPLLPTEVVGQDVSPWFRSLLLDRGNSDRVRAGMPVVDGHGLVGLVTATMPSASRTMLLLDRRSAVDAMIQRSRARGIVRGRGAGDLEFVFMVRGDDVRPGDEVITSGVGGVYPKGLRVGTVTSVRTDRDELLHAARVDPVVDFGRLEQVFVMLRRGPTMELLYAGEGDLPAAAPKEAP
jgi:rod shape-determining protein MreC